MKKLVCGVGINDADYVVQPVIDGKQQICPFYKKWHSMLVRVYSPKAKKHRLSYEGTSVCDEWLTFSNFKVWMETKDWKDKQLDKDILVYGNREYGPDVCCFVDNQTNNFILENTPVRGKYPIGVCFNKKLSKFMSSCMSVVTGKSEYFGLYNTAEEAHKAWLAFKLSQAHVLAERQTDTRVAQALISRYENWEINTNLI